MAWPRVGDAYFETIGDAVRLAAPARAAAPAPGAMASSLPELCLDHLRRMTDDTGIIQHATYSVPARRTGYCVDDNARALIVAVLADRMQSSRATRALVTTYLSYLHVSQEPDGTIRNFMSYDRVLDDAAPSHDCTGRAIWALGVSAALAQEQGCRTLAREMLTRALAHAPELNPRGSAHAILGLVSLLGVEPGAAHERALLDRAVARLTVRYRDHATPDWRWFEPTLTYDNAILPLALFAAYEVTGERATLRAARESLEFLEEICFPGDRLELVGNAGWHAAGQEKAYADEQAIDAAAFVLAFRCAYKVTEDRHYLRRMHEAFAWFLGANRLERPLYDFSTGGCRDGMGAAHVNENQGAESTICFLLSLLKMLELAGETFERDDKPESSTTLQ
jgi:hypothetical protein